MTYKCSLIMTLSFELISNIWIQLTYFLNELSNSRNSGDFHLIVL